jgi:hypothetical protein
MLGYHRRSGLARPGWALSFVTRLIEALNCLGVWEGGMCAGTGTHGRWPLQCMSLRKVGFRTGDDIYNFCVHEPFLRTNCSFGHSFRLMDYDTDLRPCSVR